ncbi:MAG: multidrug efflux MFS transporter [Peptococcaceae bacterium]|nr:multidrug efflux MFS transporter [Peptococcaceae bacterium]
MAKKADKDRLDPKLVRILLIMLIGTMMPMLDATVVNVAIKTIISEFNSTVSIAQWLTTAYILALGIAVPVSGWLVNRFSMKTVYQVVLALFGVGSVGAALAWNMESLIAFRVVQGAGAGVILPVMQTVLVRYSGRAKLARVMAIFGIPAAIIPVLGPTVGGLIVSSLPWQWIFIINIPICIIALILGQIHLPADAAVNKQQRLDFIGLLLLSPAFCAIIFGITAFRSDLDGAAQRGVVILAAGLILLLVYCFYVLRSKKEPPLNIRLFKDKNFSASVVLMFLFGMISTGVLFILPLYFQQVYQFSAFTAGLLLAPQGIGMLITRGFAAKWMEKFGGRPVVLAGLMCTLIGTLPFAVFFTGDNLILPVIILLIRGSGLGVVMVPVMTCVYDGLDKKDVPQGTTATRIFQQIGGAFGTAVLAIVLSHGLSVADGASTLVAFNQVFGWSAVLVAVALVPVFFLRKKSYESVAQE